MTSSQKMFDWIMARFDEGRTVYVTTYTKSTAYKPKHREMFRVSASGKWCEVASGRNWNAINFCKITAQ